MLYAMEPKILEEDHIWVVLEIPCSTDEKHMCNFFTDFLNHYVKSIQKQDVEKKEDKRIFLGRGHIFIL